MVGRLPYLLVVIALIGAGVGAALFRSVEMGIPLLPGTQQSVWQVEARIAYRATGGPTQAVLTLPPPQAGLRTINETGASSGFGLTLESGADQRRARWAKRNATGEQTLFYKIELVEDPAWQPTQASTPTPDSVTWDEPYLTSADQVLAALLPVSADGRTLAQQIIMAMNRQSAEQSLGLLTDAWSKPELPSRLLNYASVPARSVQVLLLEDGRRRQRLRDYVQVWDDDAWLLFDPASGPQTDTSNLLLWQTATPGVLEVLGGTYSRVSFSISRQTRSRLALARQDSGWMALSLYSLPIEEQNMFQLIMLLPVGALVVVFMRLLVGFRTSGTFMPVLIALAFLQTELVPGITSFLIVVAIGLLIRSYLSALNLLLVARIATLVILVITLISVFSVISYRMGLIGGLTITFFPMIILAWTIERMSIIWEEEGAREVFIQGGGSLVVAVLAYLLMDMQTVRHLAFNFPELHLVVLAVILLMGRYTGYRALELNRFARFVPANSASDTDAGVR